MQVLALAVWGSEQVKRLTSGGTTLLILGTSLLLPIAASALPPTIPPTATVPQAQPEPATVPETGAHDSVQALVQLINRYNCASPLSVQQLTSQQMNRYEAAVLLSACLEHLPDQGLDPQERRALQTLSLEFRGELAALQGRSGGLVWPSGQTSNATSSQRLHSRGEERIFHSASAAQVETLTLSAAPGVKSSAKPVLTKAPTPLKLSALDPVQWQVEEGSVRFRGAISTVNSGASFSERVLPQSSSCAVSSCGGAAGKDVSQASTTLEYTYALDRQDRNRVAMGLHYNYAKADDASQKWVGLNAEANFGNVGLFGRYSIAFGAAAQGSSQLLNAQNLQVWTAGVGIRDFIIPRSVLTVLAVRASSLSNVSSAAQVNYEAFYEFPVQKDITLAPSVVIMTSPTGSGTAPSVQGALQASFSF
ncbi:MAG TPA: hypothetical protein V6D19_04360 [Stenomitos sp.]